MYTKKPLIILIFCVSAYCSVNAQELFRQTSLPPYHSTNYQEAFKIDWNNSLNVSLPKQNNSPTKASNGWYPVKGEYYYGNETEKAADVFYTIGQNGLLDKRIFVGCSPSVYDSTVSVMNRSPYTKGKDLIDTVYSYYKTANGLYVLDLRRTYAHHYFDYFDADSFFYEIIYHRWDDANKKFSNLIKQKTGYHDTLVEFYNREDQYTPGPDNKWKLDYFCYDSITHGDDGFVNTVYFVQKTGDGNYHILSKAEIKNYEQGRFTQMEFYAKKGNDWILDETRSNITWVEWNGFTHNSFWILFTEHVSPYKRTKIESYDRYQSPYFYHYRKHWDINGTKSNIDTLYIVIEEKMYPYYINGNIYNEYGDYVSWYNISFSEPDEDGNSYLRTYSERYSEYTYDDIYGMIERKTYQTLFLEDKWDTTFIERIKYTEFAPVSIAEHPQPSKQTLTIYPNPTRGELKIKNYELGIEYMEIFDVLGRVVAIVETDNYPSLQPNAITIDISHLPAGIYLVRAVLADGGIKTGKVVLR
jgi:hypothetical protein